MKTEVPSWLAVALIVLVIALVGGWLFWRTSQPPNNTVIQKDYGDESNPFGNQPPPQGARPGAGASGP